MIIVGLITRDGDYFVIEIPSIGVVTQALGEDDIIPMTKDAIETLAHGEYKFKIKVTQNCNKVFIESDNKDFVRFMKDRMKHVS